MIRILKTLGILLMAASAYSQPLTPIAAPSYTLVAQAPPQATGLSATIVGTKGSTNYYYWIVARYISGNAIPSPALQVANAPDTLSVSNYVRLNWNAVPNATGYDILRTTTPYLPNGANSIAVASNTSANTVNDDGTALTSYTLSSQAGTSATWRLDNVSSSQPFISYDQNANLKITKLLAGGTAPSITSGFGTSPSIAGNDVAGRVTVGTGGVDSSGVITFGTAWVTAPACIANNETTTLLVKATATTTTLTLTSASAFTAADKLTWNCIGY